MKNKRTIQPLEVSTSLHDKLMKSPVYAQKMKSRTLTVSIITTLLILINLFYYMSNQENLAENQILETQYANFGSDLSI
ncbi:MAG: hypothetical protein NWR96_09650 [Crocinitomicaceae bacterium]|jgi:hypothetical protein|nr:hypothetical protein [Crocinitomicaceae bacterium]MDP4761889.1 hypothetical protein [Crocinitomicaceae bacterium]